MNIVVKNNKYKIKKNIISIPKKIVKKANKRNKIRRQIRNILMELNIEHLYIQYLELNDKPKFLDIKETICEKIKKLIN